MVLEGPLIHHLEVSKQGFVLAVLPFGKIQTRFCISWPTIQNHLGNQHCTQLFHHSKPQKRMVSNGASTCMKKVPKIGGLLKKVCIPLEAMFSTLSTFGKHKNLHKLKIQHGWQIHFCKFSDPDLPMQRNKSVKVLAQEINVLLIKLGN